MFVNKIEETCLKLIEKIGLKKMADWYRKHKEGMRYLIFGALSTVLNIILYSMMYYLLHISNAVSNVIAWILCVIFAYLTNKFYVFCSKTTKTTDLIREIVSFVGCRLATLVIDELIMVVTVDKLGWPGLIMKIIANIIVIILNFVFSKIIIFKNK